MEIVATTIKKDGKQMELTYSRSSQNLTKIYCTERQLLIHYKVKSIHQISPELIKQIIKDNKFLTIQTNHFDSVIRTIHSKGKEFTFQIEEKCLLITNNKTGDEIFSDTSKIQEDKFWDFTESKFNRLKLSKKKMVPLSHNFITNDNNFEFK